MIPDVSTSTLCSFEILDMETWTLKVSMSPLIPNNSRLIPYKIHDTSITSMVYLATFTIKTYKTSTIHVEKNRFVPWMVCEKAYWIGFSPMIFQGCLEDGLPRT